MVISFDNHISDIMDKFLIGDCMLYWDDGGYSLIKGEYFERFRISEAKHGSIEQVSCLNKYNENGCVDVLRFCGKFENLEKYTKCKKITENYSYEIYDVNDENIMIYHWAYRKLAFAIWPNRISCNQVNQVIFDPALKYQPRMNMDWLMGLVGLHKAFLQKQAPIFHASYIDYKGNAILFSAPSQTGKSTQADLWAKYAGVEIINGDRVLLRKRENIWHAYGYPSCGSSNMCMNRTLPIGAIVLLEKGDENLICEMSMTNKIRSLVVAIEVYRWDLNEVEQSLRLAQDIAMEVPVLKLVCRPDENAVRVLQEYLYKSHGL